MKQFSYELDPAYDQTPRIGLVVLQQDETLEGEARTFFETFSAEVFVSRIKSEPDVTTSTLAQMERDLPAAADLLPGARAYDAIGYGCTSGTSVIGAKSVAQLIRRGTNTRAVTDPLTAMIAWCKAHDVTRLGILSPYVQTVSETLCEQFHSAGIDPSPFGSFNVAQEAKVARISASSIVSAAMGLCVNDKPEALFLSCTNLRCMSLLPEISSILGIPAVSSNSVLLWHLKELSIASA